MQYLFNLREIFQDLFYEKTRIILTILAVAWGTFAIAIMLAVGEGLRLNFAQTMANAGNKLLTITPGATTKNYQGVQTNQAISLAKEDLTTIAQLPNVASVTPQYKFTAQLRYNNQLIDATLQAVTSEYASIHQIQVGPTQRFIKPIDLSGRSNVIVIGSLTAESLFVPGENPVGNTIYLADRPFTIIGVMQKKSEMWSSETPDARLNWIPASTFELLNNPQTIDTIAVAYNNIAQLPQTQKQIQKIIALRHGADPNDAGVVNFSELAKSQADVNQFFIGMQIFLGVIGSLTLLIAGVGIANVMYASVRRATRQIGTRMAIGATTWHILMQYITESLVATALGGIIGIIVTAVTVYLIRLIPMHGKLIDAIGKPVPVLSYLVLVIVIFVLGTVGFLAGFFPALKAAKIDPAEALTYE